MIELLLEKFLSFRNEISALGMLANMAMKKFLEEEKKTNLDEIFGVEKQGARHKDGEEGATNCRLPDGKEYDPATRPESGIASQSDTDSDEDREDGKIHFRYDEYHELQQFEMSQQNYDEEPEMEEETV